MKCRIINATLLHGFIKWSVHRLKMKCAHAEGGSLSAFLKKTDFRKDADFSGRRVGITELILVTKNM